MIRCLRYALIVATVAGAFKSSAADACSCLQNEDAKQVIADTPIVFTGRVVSVVDDTADSSSYGFYLDSKPSLATIDIIIPWKGVSTSTVVVSFGGGRPCDVWFVEGQLRTVLAYP